MIKNLLILLTLALIHSCSKPIVYDLVISDVHLFNGNEDLGVMHVGINDDSIAAISIESIEGDSVIKGTGKFMIPGFVNAHVHANQIEDLQKGYPYGILTLLNMHTGLEERETHWKAVSQDSVGFSSLYGAGHAATVPDGHPTQFSPDMETINDSISIASWVDHRISSGVDYIKVIHQNRGFMDDQGPSLTYQQIKDIIDYAHQKELKVVVHATTVEEMAKIAPFRPDGFVHMIDFKDELPVSDAYFSLLKDNGVFIVTTGGISLKSMDNLPPFMLDWVDKNFLDSDERAEIIKGYYEEGILLVTGTDAQEGQMNFAEDYFLELQLYKKAGLPNIEILKAATGNARKAFDLPIGTLAVGGKADFVLLDENPLEDISNLTKISQVWKNGKTK